MVGHTGNASITVPVISYLFLSFCQRYCYIRSSASDKPLREKSESPDQWRGHTVFLTAPQTFDNQRFGAGHDPNSITRQQLAWIQHPIWIQRVFECAQCLQTRRRYFLVYPRAMLDSHCVMVTQ